MVQATQRLPGTRRCMENLSQCIFEGLLKGLDVSPKPWCFLTICTTTYLMARVLVSHLATLRKGCLGQRYVNAWSSLLVMPRCPVGTEEFLVTQVICMHMMRRSWTRN